MWGGGYFFPQKNKSMFIGSLSERLKFFMLGNWKNSAQLMNIKPILTSVHLSSLNKMMIQFIQNNTINFDQVFIYAA